MKIDIQEVKNAIRDAVERYTGIRIDDDDKNLFSTELQPIIANYLYVLKAIEEKYGVSIYRIIEQHDYSVFTINHLAEEIVRESQIENCTTQISGTS